MATPGLDPALTSLLQQRASDSSPNSALCSALRRAQYRHERFGYLSGREASILHSRRRRAATKRLLWCGGGAIDASCSALLRVARASEAPDFYLLLANLPSLNGSRRLSIEPFATMTLGLCLQGGAAAFVAARAIRAAVAPFGEVPVRGVAQPASKREAGRRRAAAASTTRS